MIKRKKIDTDIYKYLPVLEEKLKEDKDIIFVYIFGGYGKGKVSPLSDFDIGIYIEENLDTFEKKIYLNSVITSILKTDEVDIVILNNAPCVLVYNILKTGKLLFSKDEKKRIGFVVKNINEYFEMQYYLKIFREDMFKRIEEGRYGYK
ncbi:MAG: type VII toxin-antitoxin system MntA family adenylyltransferase antitoxin [Candidatus Ratteibacteria bacterium]